MTSVSILFALFLITTIYDANVCGFDKLGETQEGKRDFWKKIGESDTYPDLRKKANTEEETSSVQKRSSGMKTTWLKRCIGKVTRELKVIDRWMRKKTESCLWMRMYSRTEEYKRKYKGIWRKRCLTKIRNKAQLMLLDICKIARIFLKP